MWIHQCGSVQEAQAAAAAGADAVIAQGVEAGGHVRGTTPMLELLERTRAAVTIPVLAAGGIIDAAGVKSALDGGAAAVGRRHALPAQRREPRAPRLQAPLPGSERDGPDRAVRNGLARRSASRDRQRRDPPLGPQRPARAPLDTSRQPTHRTSGRQDPGRGSGACDQDPALFTALPRPAAGNRRRTGQSRRLRPAPRRDECQPHHGCPAGGRTRQALAP